MQKILALFLIIFIGFQFQDCKVVKKAKSGADAFDVKQYFLAANLYEKEFEAVSNPIYKAKLAYGAAVSYQRMNETLLASQWFKQAADLDFGDIAWKEYGNSLIQLGLYDQAIQVYETLLMKKGSSEEIKLLISSARQSSLLAKESLNFYTVAPIDLNTPAGEYSPSITPGGELVFTSDRPNTTNTEIYKWTGRSFSDLYVGQKTGASATPMDIAINTIYNEGTANFNISGDIMIFTRCAKTIVSDVGTCKLMMSKYEAGKWSEPIKLDFQKENINYEDPCFAANDSVIFFASDDERGEGGFDIYYTEWNDNKWSNPERLGKRINTKYNDRFPFMYQDTLYFASDRIGGLGGLDIYKSFANAEGEWQPAINLKSPINSNEDDFGLVIDPSSSEQELRGFFSSSRSGGQGKDDIYSFLRTMTDESVLANNEPKKDTLVKKKEIRYQLFLNVKVNQLIRENADDPNSKVVEKKALPNTSVLLKENDKPIQLRTNANGNAFTEVGYDNEYFAIAIAPGLLNSSQTFNTKEIKDPDNPIKTISVEINLDKSYAGKEVIIADIYYDLDKWDIRPDAEPPLNALAQMLKDNPRIKIQLSSHTDCRATEEYNLELSNKRAKSAVDYLIKNGIISDRLIPRGFGESQLVTTCICEQCTEEEHQANRRTTFMILN